ncbi:MAG TPA: PAS domain S-box protein [Bryobacteraceae bacterium]|nr:PAS domain S-box protein [Bryobacteraceae bacterium]
MQSIRSDRPESNDLPALYALLVSQLRQAVVFLLDVDGRIASWNPGVEHLLGYSPSEWVGQSGSMIFTQDDRERGEDRKELETAIRNGDASDVRWHVRKDGSLLFVDGMLQALRSDDGTLLGFAKLMKDATERKRAEQALQGSEERFRLAEEGAEFGVWDWDIRQNRIVRSTEHYRLFGEQAQQRSYTFEEWLCLVHPDDREEMKATMEGALADGRIDCEFRILRGDGEVRWLHGAGRVYYEHGEPVRLVRVVRDVTEWRRLLQELQRSNEELTQFSHVVSHDVQAPIRTIMCFTELLARGYRGKLDHTADEYIAAIQGAASSMQQLVETLLRYAMAGQDPVDLQDVPLGSVLDAVLAVLQPDIQQAQANVVFGSLPTVRADRVLLQQLMQNLIANAVKYRKPETPPVVRVDAAKRNREWLVTVADNGMGIDPVYHDTIFAPLRRLHGASIPGTGMGLAVCRRVVERHGGRIWVESQPGAGATFCFTLPERGLPVRTVPPSLPA